MKTYNAIQLIEKLQQDTEELLNKAVHHWQMISPGIFSKQPLPESWSAKQCISHLNMYGYYYLPKIEEGIKKYQHWEGDTVETFKPGLLGNYFTKIMSPNAEGLPVKKFKAFKNYISRNTEPGDEVIATFIDQQEKLLLLLETAKRVNLNKIKIPLSINKFIKLKLGDVFMFLIAHNQRHVLQAERALKTTEVLVNNPVG